MPAGLLSFFTPLYQIATGSIIPNAYYGGVSNFTSRTPMIARATATRIRVAIPNFYLDPSAGVLQAVAAYTPRTYWAAFESSGGVITSFTFQGAASSGPLAAGTYFIETDDLPVTLNPGDQFFIRLGQNCADSTFLIWNTRAQGSFTLLPNTAMGEHSLAFSDPSIWTFQPYGNWATSGGTLDFTDATHGLSFRPFAVLGNTTQPSVAIIGDSRAVGAADNWDASGDLGEVARSIGQRYGYINAATSGISAATLATPAKLVTTVIMPQLARYCSHLVEESGGNDCLASTAAATTLANKQALWNLWPRLSKVATTTVPGLAQSFSSWNVANNPPSQLAYQLNGLLQSSGTKCFDVASAVSTGGSTTFAWRQQSYTSDGVHESQAGDLAIKNSGAIDLSWFGS